MGSAPGFHSSIHSSLVEASVPAQATSLMRTEPGAKDDPEESDVASTEGVVVGVGVGDSGLAEGVSDGKAATVGTDPESGEVGAVSDGEAVTVGTDSESGEADGVSVALGVSVAVALDVSGNVGLSLGSGVAVGPSASVSVGAGGGSDGEGSMVLATVLTGESVTATSVESEEVAEGMASSKDGEAEVGSERRGAASSSPARSAARARRWCWVMVVPPGPVGWRESTSVEAGCQYALAKGRAAPSVTA